MTHNEDYLSYKVQVDEILSVLIDRKEPSTLYEPLKYILNGGGKRIRPMMVIFCCEAVGGNFKDALNASVAMELLHNFTLVHDDIMDNAETRRGKKTIHKKWNENVAILSGDHLIGLAYKYLLKTKSNKLNSIMKIFTEGITEVCEGQSYDKEFEESKDVTLDEYIMMIEKKTAKMLETSAVIGALIGEGNDEQINNIKNYAHNIGLAFQIQDDLLDIIANEKDLGKKIGGDIVEGKKTYLLLKALEVTKQKNDRDKLLSIINKKEADSDFIEEIKKIYMNNGVIDDAQKEIEKYTKLAETYLEKLKDGKSKDRLRWLSGMLMGRAY